MNEIPKEGVSDGVASMMMDSQAEEDSSVLRKKPCGNLDSSSD